MRVFRDQAAATLARQRVGTHRATQISKSRGNVCFNLQGLLTDSTTNEFKFGYNAAPTQLVGQAPIVNGTDFSKIILNLSGSVANTGIAGQGASSGITVPGGLIRANSAPERDAQPYGP